MNPYQRDVIRRVTAEVAGPGARVLLFGSRTRADARGGDIDLLIELDQASADHVVMACRIGARIERQLGAQKIDVLIADPATPRSSVLDAARRDGVAL